MEFVSLVFLLDIDKFLNLSLEPTVTERVMLCFFAHDFNHIIF